MINPILQEKKPRLKEVKNTRSKGTQPSGDKAMSKPKILDF